MIRCVLQRAATHAARAFTQAQARSVSTSAVARAIAQARGGGQRHVQTALVKQVKPKAYHRSAAMATRGSSQCHCQCAAPGKLGSYIVRGMQNIDVAFWKNFAAYLVWCYGCSKVIGSRP